MRIPWFKRPEPKDASILPYFQKRQAELVAAQREYLLHSSKIYPPSRLQERDWGKPLPEFSGKEVGKMGRREFLKYAAATSVVAGASGFFLRDLISTVKATPVPGAGGLNQSGTNISFS